LLEFDFLGLVKEEFDGIGFGLLVDLFLKENFFLGTSWEFNLPRDCFKFSMDLREERISQGRKLELSATSFSREELLAI
jgi:hypothetical protein